MLNNIIDMVVEMEKRERSLIKVRSCDESKIMERLEISGHAEHPHRHLLIFMIFMNHQYLCVIIFHILRMPELMRCM